MGDPIPVQAVVKVTVWAWIKKAVQDAWAWLMAWTQFLDDANGKFSHKRLIALALTIVCIRQIIIADYLGAIIAGGIAMVLAFISALTKT